jgi:hypothetical protein
MRIWNGKLFAHILSLIHPSPYSAWWKRGRGRVPQAGDGAGVRVCACCPPLHHSLPKVPAHAVVGVVLLPCASRWWGREACPVVVAGAGDAPPREVMVLGSGCVRGTPRCTTACPRYQHMMWWGWCCSRVRAGSGGGPGAGEVPGGGRGRGGTRPAGVGPVSAGGAGGVVLVGCW